MEASDEVSRPRRTPGARDGQRVAAIMAPMEEAGRETAQRVTGTSGRGEGRKRALHTAVSSSHSFT